MLNKSNSFKLSNRLTTVAGWITKGNTVADIGTDHGYLPIYIIKNNISDKVIAMDVRKGPLEKAKNNMEAFKVGNAVELRLSDGLEKLDPLEADTITICGMGGKLMRNILEKGKDIIKEDTQLILSPQSEIREFRLYLYNNNFHVTRETMIKEEGKFYLIMECKKVLEDEGISEQEDILNEIDGVKREAFLRFGKKLIEEKNVYLKEFIEKERRKSLKVLAVVEGLDDTDQAVATRKEQINFDLKCFEYVLERY